MFYDQQELGLKRFTPSGREPARRQGKSRRTRTTWVLTQRGEPTVAGIKSRRMKLLAVLALGAMLAVALTAAASPAPPKPVTVDPMNPQFLFSSSFAPTALAAGDRAPIKLKLSAEFLSPEGGGGQPPAVRELLIKADRNLTIDTKGLPSCNPSLQIDAAGPGGIPERCMPALVGEGSIVISLAFPDSAPIKHTSGVLIYNGGTRGTTTKLFAYAMILAPTPAALEAKIKIKKIQDGRFGAEATAAIPKIAAGSGAIVSFNATIGRQYLYKHKRRSVFTLRCPTAGEIFTDAQATFADASTAEAEVIRTCTRR